MRFLDLGGGQAQDRRVQRSVLLTDVHGSAEPLGWTRLSAVDARTDPRTSWSLRTQSESLQSDGSPSVGTAVPVCFGVNPQPSKPPRVNAPVDVPHVFHLVPTDVIP